MDVENYHSGKCICFLCRKPALHEENTFFYGFPFHVECLNKIGTNWLEFCPDNPTNPPKLFKWLIEQWDAEDTHFMIYGERLREFDGFEWGMAV